MIPRPIANDTRSTQHHATHYQRAATIAVHVATIALATVGACKKPNVQPTVTHNNATVVVDAPTAVASDAVATPADSIANQHECSNGNTKACFELGVAYEGGTGVAKKLALVATCRAAPALVFCM
jgi:hypothetical protein